VKAKVTLVEQHKMGGDCLNYGCVPSKALIKTATLVRQMRHSADYGVAQASWTLDFAQVMERVAHVVREVEPHDSVQRYTGLGVDVQLGSARILDPWHVQITAADGGVQTLSTRSIVVATGARPFVPPLPGLEECGYLTSDTLWGLRELPPRLVVLGGGPIGCELAQSFARLGSAVTQVEMAPRLMLREDEDVSAYALQALQADGVKVLTGHKALRCERQGSDKFLVVERGHRAAHRLRRALVRRGPRGALAGLRSGRIGRAGAAHHHHQRVLADQLPQHPGRGRRGRALPVHAHRGAPGLVRGGQRAVRHVPQVQGRLFRHPWCTFIDPEVARVGLNEQEAREKGIAFEVTRYGIDDLDRAIADSAAQGWVKVLTVPGKDRILGVTIVGVHAGDLLAEYVLAMKHGLGLNKILGTIHTYPTWAEANKYAAGEWKRAHQPLGLLRWVERFHAWRRGLAWPWRCLAGAAGGRQQPGHGLARGHAAAAEAPGHALHARTRAGARGLRVEADGSYGNLVHGFARRPCRPRWPGRGACRHPPRPATCAARPATTPPSRSA
jgi:pyruvate/2-oxoglutarate dehydrogenase complex dihydrolipoamide dehydrogenase (E3) component